MCRKQAVQRLPLLAGRLRQASRIIVLMFMIKNTFTGHWLQHTFCGEPTSVGSS
ncbi:MAG: hypothetical protein N2050_08190 [Flavobacteriales bacterium]|nr:hypothetical protein [Flavobacteriales bacterium]